MEAKGRDKNSKYYVNKRKQTTRLSKNKNEKQKIKTIV